MTDDDRIAMLEQRVAELERRLADVESWRERVYGGASEVLAILKGRRRAT
jgi:hypothetical protein